MRYITRIVNTDNKVQMLLKQEQKVSLGVERLWQISCTLPAILQENSGLQQLGLQSMATRLQRMLELSLYGNIMLERSWVGLQDNGRFYLAMTVTQFEHESDLSLEQ